MWMMSDWCRQRWPTVPEKLADGTATVTCPPFTFPEKLEGGISFSTHTPPTTINEIPNDQDNISGKLPMPPADQWIEETF
jgi:hypothetical protein